MALFLIRRIGHGVLVLWLITVAVFGLFFVAPSNVARTLAGRQATPETVALIKHRLGLDLPVWKQYLHFLGNALKGNLGYDYYHQVPVTTIIGQALPIHCRWRSGRRTVVGLGVFNGVISADRPVAGRPGADAVLVVLLLVADVPARSVVALLPLLPAHAGRVHWFPAGGYSPLHRNAPAWSQHLLLPWVALALLLAATYTRLTRGSMLDVLGEDYIRTARSKGIRESRVVVRHGLRSALTPVVTQFGIDLGQLIGGVVVIETVFSLPGLGQTAVVAINQQDLPVIIGIVLFALGRRRGREHPGRHRVRRAGSAGPIALRHGERPGPQTGTGPLATSQTEPATRHTRYAAWRGLSCR